ncbi:MAG TPA: TIGR02444 family protein, partial [Alphaproteobacteria bacterium]|nr:TIGR02444 family protein [Alphaproteobacteria bacterium]
MAYTDPSIDKKSSWPQESLWDYSLAYYARDNVPQFLLALQDQYDLDVNLILLAIWAGAESGLLLKEEHFSKL